MLRCLTCARALRAADGGLTCPACRIHVPLLHGTTYDVLTAYGLETPDLRRERETWNTRGEGQVSGDATYDASLSWAEWWQQTPHRRQFAPLIHQIPLRGASVLEIGGLGTRGLRLLEHGIARYCHVEVSDGSQVGSRRLFAQHGHDAPSERITYVRAAAEWLPFEDRAFDLVLSHGTLHHTTRLSSYPEVARVLKPGGYFVFTDNFASPLVKPLLAFYRPGGETSDDPLDERDVRLLRRLFQPLKMGACGGLEWLQVYWHRARGRRVAHTGLTRRLRVPQVDHVVSRYLFRGGLTFVGTKP